jgi:hypothetical protein
MFSLFFAGCASESHQNTPPESNYLSLTNKSINEQEEVREYLAHLIKNEPYKTVDQQHATYKKEGEAVKGLQAIKIVPLNYPPLSQIMESEGQVHAIMIVDTRGIPTAIKIFPEDPTSIDRYVKSKSIIEAVSEWRFEPAKVDSTPVSIIAVLPVVYKMKKE